MRLEYYILNSGKYVKIAKKDLECRFGKDTVKCMVADAKRASKWDINTDITFANKVKIVFK